MLLIALAFAAVAGVTIYYGYQERENEERRTIDQISGASQLMAQGRSDSYASTQTYMETFAEAREILVAVNNPDSPFAREACHDKFNAATESFVGLVQFGLFDASGRRICSSATADRGTAADPVVTDRLDFQNAVATGTFAVGEVISSRSSNELFMTFAYPFVPVGAVLRLGMALDRSPPPAIPPSVPEGTEYSLVDRSGLVITSSHRETGSVIESLGAAGRTLPVSRATITSEGTTVDGSPSMDIITRVTESGQAPVYVVLSVPPDVLASPLADVLLPEMLIVSMLALVTLAIAWFVGEALIVRPAEALARATGRLRSGKASGPLDVPTDESELGQVGTALQQMARELTENVEELERALAAKEEFLSLVSHELRTPVTTILGNAQVLESRWETLDDETRGTALADVRDEAQRLRQIIENLLLLARLESGQALDVEPVILRRAILRIVNEHEQKFPERRYDVQVPAQIALAEANPQCIEQIMNNLLGNAEKYSPPNSPITIRISPEENAVSVSVGDRGIGVNPDEVDALFTPFFRSKRTNGSKGIGIGLSVCQRLVEAQGGSISARPREGGGSIFTFTLRAAEESPEEEDRSEDASQVELAPP